MLGFSIVYQIESLWEKQIIISPIFRFLILSEQANQVIFKSYLDIGTKFYFAKRPLIGVKVMAFNGNIKIFTNNSIT